MLAELNRLATKAKKPPKLHKSAACLGCGQHPIRGPRYHCLMCPRTDLCKRCSDSHTQHPLIKKKSELEKWEAVPMLANFQNLQNRELGAEDYERLLDLDRNPPLFEFLLSVVPNGHPGMCCVCNVAQPCRWKLLECGHSVHDACLLNNLRDENYVCPIDLKPILKGLEVEAASYSAPILISHPESELTISGQQIASSHERPNIKIRRRPNPPSAPIRREELYLGPPPRGRFNETRSDPNRRKVSVGRQISQQEFELPGLVVTRLTNPTRKGTFINSAQAVLNR